MRSSTSGIFLFLGVLLLALTHAASGDSQAAMKSHENAHIPQTLTDLLDALDGMQSEYFELWTGTWPSSIDWTAAVIGTHISSTLMTVTSTIDYTSTQCPEIREWENLVNRYFSHLIAFYFGENAFGLRNQAYDDMLWVVLGWLENVKFSTLYAHSFWPGHETFQPADWYGTHLADPAAHRARIFYDIASRGWDTSLCKGGMVWNPSLEPYKNAITNELYISASIAMYLYFPGDNSTSPFIARDGSTTFPSHDEKYLENAIKGYRWLKSSNMTDSTGLYMDGYHITGWKGRDNPGSKKCDDLNPMVYTYNQGVLLSGLKGLWIATNRLHYLEEGHSLIQAVIKATGWPKITNASWSGLGRAGVLEEYCDHKGECSQDGQTFKGIFFHHLSEFCRSLWDSEKDFMYSDKGSGLDQNAYRSHEYRCLGYSPWVEHNANAALETRDEKGFYGTWWGQKYKPDGASSESAVDLDAPLPQRAVDFRNYLEPYGSRWSTMRNPGDDESTEESESPITPINARNTKDVNERGRGRTVETQSGGIGVLRALLLLRSLLGKVASGDLRTNKVDFENIRRVRLL